MLESLMFSKGKNKNWTDDKTEPTTYFYSNERYTVADFSAIGDVCYFFNHTTITKDVPLWQTGIKG